MIIMELPRPSQRLLYLILAFTLASTCCISCEKLATVFILEASDSDSNNKDSSPPAIRPNNNSNYNNNYNPNNSNYNNNNNNNNNQYPNPNQYPNLSQHLNQNQHMSQNAHMNQNQYPNQSLNQHMNQNMRETMQNNQHQPQYVTNSNNQNQHQNQNSNSNERLNQSGANQHSNQNQNRDPNERLNQSSSERMYGSPSQGSAGNPYPSQGQYPSPSSSQYSGSNQYPSLSPSPNQAMSNQFSNQYQHQNQNQSQNQRQELPKYPLNEKNCGTVHETRIVGGDDANPDDFLWMAAIIKSKPTDGEVRPFCGGSLITRRHILTAAHCLENLAPRDVLVRLGSYDFDDATASSYSADYAIDQFRVPSNYSKKTHAADIAIMRLKTPLSLQDNYKTVCMPQPRRSYVGALATVTGYGSQSQTFRRATPKLRQVTVPIWENRRCSVVYKKNLTESFLCAGYEEGGKDACQGDSGGPLMTEGPNERMMIVGVVSHGIGCGSPGYPGVYTRTTTFLDWIEKNTKE